MAEAPKQQQAQIKADEKELLGQYSNLVVVHHNAEEFTLNFVYMFPTVAQGKLVASLILNPRHAKRLLARAAGKRGAVRGPIRHTTRSSRARTQILKLDSCSRSERRSHRGFEAQDDQRLIGSPSTHPSPGSTNSRPTAKPTCGTVWQYATRATTAKRSRQRRDFSPVVDPPPPHAQHARPARAYIFRKSGFRARMRAVTGNMHSDFHRNSAFRSE